jgi:hypothetical protein
MWLKSKEVNKLAKFMGFNLKGLSHEKKVC